MTRATHPARPERSCRRVGSRFASQAKKSLPARFLEGPWPPRRLIATHQNSEIALAPLRTLNIVFSNRNTIPVSAIALFRGQLITNLPRGRASRAKGHSSLRFCSQQGENRIRYNLLKTKDRDHF